MTMEGEVRAFVPLDVTGVPHFTLAAVKSRSAEARRPDGMLNDPRAVVIDYGIAGEVSQETDRAHVVRSLAYDVAVRAFLDTNPHGTVVHLWDALTTRTYRVASKTAYWLCVGTPEGLALRERFIRTKARYRHRSAPELGAAWYDDVPDGGPLLFVFPGAFHRYRHDELLAFLSGLAQRFPEAHLLIDGVVGWSERSGLPRVFHRGAAARTLRRTLGDPGLAELPLHWPDAVSRLGLASGLAGWSSWSPSALRVCLAS